MAGVRWIVAIAVATVFSACRSQTPLPAFQQMQIEVGKPFPDHLFPGLVDGSPASIAQFRGKKTLLHVFASW